MVTDLQSTIPLSALGSVRNLADGHIDLGDGQMYIKRIDLDLAGEGDAIDVSSGSEVDTGWDLPADAVVLDVFLKVTAAEATGTTKTIDVGLLSSETGGDADGFIDGLSVAATGIKQPNFVLTVGSNETYLGAAATHTLGALFTGGLSAGTDLATDVGTAFKKLHAADAVTAKSVSVTVGSANFAEFEGSLFIRYIRLSTDA